MKRRVHSAAWCLFAAVSLAACDGGRKQPDEVPRTVILISIDTLRADRLGAYGAAGAETPALDALARESVVFEAAWTPVPLTLPAHASMLTGLYPPRHGVRANGVHRLASDVPVVPEALRRAGFRTAAFIGGYPLARRFGLDRGFDHYDDDLPVGAQGFRYPERRGGDVVDRVLAWTAGQPDAQPVFLLVHLYDPHADYAPPPPFAQRFAARPYDGEVAYVDSLVARLRDGLGRRWTTAGVVLVADHGESLGEHGEETHGILLYESTLRVPFLVKAQGIAPTRIREPVSLVDVAPTLLAVAGLAVTTMPALDGVSLVAGVPRRDLYAETLAPYLDHGWSGLRALRRGGRKLIDGSDPELFELEGDPGEARNLWPSPAGEPLWAALRAAIARLGRTPAAPAALDAEARQALASLGYAASSADVPDDFGAGRPAPRTRMDVARELDSLEGEPADARARLIALTRRDPGNNLVWRRLAAVSVKMGDFEAAVRAYGQAARTGYRGDDLAEALAEAHLRAAETRGNASDLAGARRHLEGAVTLRPRRAEIRHALGVVEARAGRLGAAVRAFQDAGRLDPRFAPAWFSLGLAEERRGRRVEADAAYRRFLELDPKPTPERDHARRFLSTP